jgi:serine/threonine protein kinase
VIEEYEQVGVLGEGGFGRVVLARHKVGGEMVAIKYVKKDITNGNINDNEMIFAEANALKNLHHKNIVKMLNCFIF